MRKRVTLIATMLVLFGVAFVARAGAGAGADAGSGGGTPELAPAAAAAELTLGPLHLFSTPVRSYDSRPGSGVLGADSGPVVGTSRRVAIRVPSTAIAAEVNVTATNTSSFGYLRAFAIDEVPEHSNLNWNAPGQSIANQITVAVTRAGVAQAGCTTQCIFEFNVETAGSADVVIDVVGYYNA
jgi:hypothetical protein